MLARVLGWLLPSICPGCSRDVGIGGPVCRGCLDSFSAPGEAAPPPGVGRFHALWDFSGPLRDVVHSFKYRGRGYLGDVLGGWMAPRLPDWAARADAIVSVPSPALRRIRRGYHPAEVLAEALSRAYGRPLLRRTLSRGHFHPSQTALGRADRVKNADKSFRLGRGARRTGGLNVLLVDDVSTTGSTLSACARLLRAAGAESVDAVTLAQERLGSARS